MPPKSRPLSRTSSRGRPRQASQFGELETTPTSRCHESPRPVSSHAAGSETQLIEDIAYLMTDIDRQGPQLADAGDISATAPADVGVGCSATFAWSDTGSVARRSSPLRPGDTPGALWRFDDESLPPLSSAKSARTNLPETAPLPLFPSPDKQLDGAATSQKNVDFSETATTARRSSPLIARDAVEQVFDFFEKGSKDNIYDATPREDVSAKCDRPDVDQPQLPGESSSVANDPAGQDDKHLSDEAAPSTENHDSGLIITRNIANKAAKRFEKGKKSVPITEVPGSSAVIPSSGSVQGAASKRYSNKRKQRAKPPLEFDAASHDFKGPPHSAAMKSKARMPIVNALRESVQLSSSPATQARKRQEPPTSSSQPKKRARATRKKVQAASTVEVSTALMHIQRMTSEKNRARLRKVDLGQDFDDEKPNIDTEELAEPVVQRGVAPQLQTAPDDTSRTRISEEVQAQILASLRDLKTPSEQEGSDTGTDESEAMDGSIEPAPKPAPVTAKDQVAQELHSVVDMMMDTISSKEVKGFDVAKTYQEKILNCVDRIESRQSRERDAAFSRAEEDFGLFRSLIGDAKTLIKGKRQVRERTMRDLDAMVGKRKKRIDHATSKLGDLGQDDSDAAVAP
ncbi:hypothetical protein PLIIFM63780_003740 [Purpureocillium lilacinum]|nr:hypothetical protein PLIIFM63780_003740 [Purpureocillium lilacinum]